MYIYRFDSIEALYWQRFSDKTLRARRSAGDEQFFSHFQVRDAHYAAQSGCAVFRMSFWKSLLDAKKQSLYKHDSALQRIKDDHPVISMFQRGDDEHLSKEAYLYWATMTIDEGNPDWSPVGISHDDIEVLLPDNTWVSMNQVGVLRDTEPDWSTFWLQSFSGRDYPIQIKHGQSANGDYWALIRQRLGPWRVYLNNLTELAPLIEKVINECVSLPERCRWAYALEMHDRVMGIELFPKFVRRKRNGFICVMDYLRKIDHRGGWSVHLVHKSKKQMAEPRVSNIYQSFGCSDLLVRGDNWVYV